MKRLVVKVFALAAVLLGTIYVGSQIYARTSAYTLLKQFQGVSDFSSVPDEIDVAVFGASHAKAGFRSPPEGKVFFNFAMSSQSPQYDYMQMLEFQDRIKPGALIVIIVSYQCPFWPDHDDTFDSKQARYYKLLSPEHIIDYDPFKDLMYDHFCLLAENLATITKSFLDKEALQNDPVELDVSTIAAQQIDVSSRHLTMIMDSFPEPSAGAMEAYDKMLQLCEEKDWNAVIVTVPFLDEYTDIFPDEIYPVFYGLVDQLCEKYDVPYLDFSDCEQFKGRYDLYADIDHLDQG